jgi:intraflagellar transport protein 56
MHTLGSGRETCDTIQGRQAMAAVLYHNGLYGDVITYLNSIKAYFSDAEQEFNWNLSMALVASGRFKEGLETLEKIDEYR